VNSFAGTTSVSLIAILGVATSFAQPCSGATIIVSDGGSVSAAVTAAAHGDTIEIQSNQFFNETLSWSNKYLTVRAGAGFTPGISNITNLNGTSSITGGSFSGLSIDSLTLSATSTRFSNVSFQQVTFNQDVSIGGTGSYTVTALFDNVHFKGAASFSGTGDQSLDAHFTNDSFDRRVSLGGTGRSVHKAIFENDYFTNGLISNSLSEVANNVTVRNSTSLGNMNFVGNSGSSPVLVEDNHITGQLTFATSIADHIDATASRNVVIGPVIFAVGTFANSKLTMRNNLIVSPPAGTPESGIDVRALGGDFQSNTTFTLTNNSVVGFDRGLTTENLQTGGTFNAQIQNMLLYNADDVNGFTAAQIGNSLISDGTFAGLNGNFGGSPILTADYYLKYNSIGIDAGSNSAAASLATDLRGNPRIQDANGDGIARVDVGALETAAVPEPSALMAVMIAVPMISAGRRLWRPYLRGNTCSHERTQPLSFPGR
jgi:hypothetical protein